MDAQPHDASTGAALRPFQRQLSRTDGGPATLAPTRNFTFPAQDNLNWNDLTYRTGLIYDLLGNGKTAVKLTFNKYLLGQTPTGWAPTRTRSTRW